jgi:hypothetical protein
MTGAMSDHQLGIGSGDISGIWAMKHWKDFGRAYAVNAMFSFENVAAPEPASVLLAGLGAAGLGGGALLRRRARARRVPAADPT